MLVKINKKPIKVVEESEERSFDPIYFCVSVTGYVACLWIVDVVCYTFFFIHPFPLILPLVEVLKWIF